jgi:hypothetical protein
VLSLYIFFIQEVLKCKLFGSSDGQWKKNEVPKLEKQVDITGLVVKQPFCTLGNFQG